MPPVLLTVWRWKRSSAVRPIRRSARVEEFARRPALAQTAGSVLNCQIPVPERGKGMFIDASGKPLGSGYVNPASLICARLVDRAGHALDRRAVMVVTREADRTRIRDTLARDLHDNVTQILSSINLLSQTPLGDEQTTLVTLTTLADESYTSGPRRLCHREAQTRSFPHLFGCEERLSDFGQLTRGDAATGIRDPDAQHGFVGWRILYPRELHAYLATPRHGIARINDKVHHRQLELSTIYVEIEPEIGAIPFHRHRSAQRMGNQPRHTFAQGGWRHVRGRQLLLAGKSHQSADQFGPLGRRVTHLFDHPKFFFA